MAKDLNTSNLSVVNAHGAVHVMAGERTIEVGAVYLDGERLDGVYAEVRSGELVGLGVEHGAVAVRPYDARGRCTHGVGEPPVRA